METLKIEIKGYEQISKEQYNKLQNKERLERLELFEDNPKKRNYYLKKTGKLEENLRRIENEKMAIQIYGDGFEIINKTGEKELFLGYDNNFSFLVKAIKKAEKFAEKYQKELKEKLK